MEKLRTFTFTYTDSEEIFENVAKEEMCSAGHMLFADNGAVAIVAPGWRYVTIEEQD